MADSTDKTQVQDVALDELKIRAATDQDDQFESANDDSFSEEADSNKDEVNANSGAGADARDEAPSSRDSEPETGKKSNRDSANKSQSAANQGDVLDAETASKLNLRPYYGVWRHRLILAGCFTVAAVILAMSTMDLKQLFYSSVQIDKSMNSRPLPVHPELAPNLTYPERDYTSYRDFSEGLCPVLESTWTADKHGYVDRNGNIAIKPQFSDADDFHDGLARVRPYVPPRSTEKYDVYQPPPLSGFIDKSGKMVIPPQFESTGDFAKGVNWVMYRRVGKQSESFGALIDKLGNIIYKGKMVSQPNRFNDDLFAITESAGKIGLMDRNGHWVLQPVYNAIDKFGQDLGSSFAYANLAQVDNPEKNSFFRILKDGHYGVVDATGKIIIPPSFDEIYSFRNGHAMVSVNSKIGFADASGKMVIPAVYDAATVYDDIISVRQEGKNLIIDSLGKVLPLKFDGTLAGANGEWLRDGLAPVCIGGKFGYLNKMGQVAIPPQFQMAFPFDGGHARIFDGAYWRYIDKNGKIASPLQFIALWGFSVDTGLAEATVPGPLTFLNNARNVTDEKNNINMWRDSNGLPRLDGEKSWAPESRDFD